MNDQYAIAVITNLARTTFLVQRKDDSYVRPRAIAFFGGALEEDETPRYAIERELVEELGGPMFEVLFDAGIVFMHSIRVNPLAEFHVFQVIVDDPTILAMSEQPVYEGERAEICTRENLLALPWLEELRPVVEDYLRRYSEFPATQVGDSSEKLA